MHRFIQARRVIRKYQLEIYHHLRDKYAKNELSEGSFGYLLMKFSEEANLTEDETLSELFIFLIAGHETTAHSISWALYSFACHPEMEEKCFQAISTIKEEEVNPFQTLPDYFEAFVKETMRKYPVASRGMLRQVMQEEGVELPTGLLNKENEPPRYPAHIKLRHRQWILISIFALHNDANNWGDDALEFKPERWLDPKRPHMQSPANFAGVGVNTDGVGFAPFALGARNCIGMNLAMFEIRSVCAKLARTFHFELVDDIYRNEKLVIQTDVTTKPMNGLPIRIKKRDVSSS